jgi:hypothetical protein
MKCMARHGHGEDANISLVILEGQTAGCTGGTPLTLANGEGVQWLNANG